MKCNICKVELDTSPLTKDCGGDCLRCMAECGDPDTIPTLLAYCRELECLDLPGTQITILEDRIALLEAALDSVMPCPALTLWPIPAHLAPILEFSRKRINGSDKT